MRPTQLTAARVQAIIDEWIATLGGARSMRSTCGGLRDVVTVSGTWTIDDSGLWLTAGAGAAVAVLPIEISDTRAVGLAALLYVESTAAAAQPTAEVLIVDDTGVTVATGSTQTAAAAIGWQLLTWSGTPAAIGADQLAFLRVTSGAASDRLGAGVLALDTP